MAPTDGSFVAGAIRSLTRRIKTLETELLVMKTISALSPTARFVFNPDAPEFVQKKYKPGEIPSIPPGIHVLADPLVLHSALEELLPPVVPQDAVCMPPEVPVVETIYRAEALLHEYHERDLRVHHDVNAHSDCADDDVEIFDNDAVTSPDHFLQTSKDKFSENSQLAVSSDDNEQDSASKDITRSALDRENMPPPDNFEQMPHDNDVKQQEYGDIETHAVDIETHAVDDVFPLDQEVSEAFAHGESVRADVSAAPGDALPDGYASDSDEDMPDLIPVDLHAVDAYDEGISDDDEYDEAMDYLASNGWLPHDEDFH